MGNINFLFENTGDFVSLNGDIIDMRRFSPHVLDDGFMDVPVAYEVIRIIRGVPMFFEDHCARLNASLAKLGADAETGAGRLRTPIAALLETNRTANCNVKIWAARNSGGNLNIFMNINRGFYPPQEYYDNGVPAGLYAHTRDDPNVKRIVPGFKEKIQAMMDNGGVFEVLLYDFAGRLTEGSRSNLFFSRGGSLYTAPDGMILKGTIRGHVFDAARSAGIPVVEKCASIDEVGLIRTAGGGLRPARQTGAEAGAAGRDTRPAAFGDNRVDGAFITGTSIGVLPLSNIGGAVLRSAENRLIRQIMDEYDKIAQDYIQGYL